ncbi:lysine-specific demethylase 5A isoform X2 [Ischnura elegans]|uniref:lysine-specific demethylase 5A isoform X2 n=1 Tax=Ischnura elegans TaxID=197161 RepID=UPI001ED89439|nr:lysine-specific demethylase 5A isoform X2 [Ischnura elegans]XP_046406091.1 lysine-specific demethylase 5A isoform X2 [Ischnura elegans]XP_046406092.1 lysine-specific demethylase 5A isoform X2 [Ischnura elegans]XP_046406093.1 lysine-specific demethylase 5A isoform X2 [Ischnura elegans]
MADSVPLSLRNIHFTPPPEALVYRPNVDEFKDPLAYINRIRPVASKYGICKIVPPDDWQPPFAVNADKLTFSPRIQKLNELEATTRIKLIFFDKIVKFWYLQGTAIKLPTIESKILDLFTLHKIVTREGGFAAVTSKDKWVMVAKELEIMDAEGKAPLIKMHYEKLLYPYDIFENNKRSSDESQENGNIKQEPPDDDQEGGDSDYLNAGGSNDTNNAEINIRIKQEVLDADQESAFILSDPEYSAEKCRGKKSGEDRDYRPMGTRKQNMPSRIQPTRSSKRLSDPVVKSPVKSKELKRLEFFGPGPKMAGFAKSKTETKGKTRGKKVKYVDPLAKYVCVNCNRGDKEAFLLLCDGCDDSYHTFCLIPSLNAVPKGDWRCPKCVAVVVDKPTEPYGFAQSKRVFTLQEFGAMADDFKSNYFHKPVHHVETHLVESEFWKLVSSIDHDVTVLYGADLHTMDLGSGFPTVNHDELLPCEREYVLSGWNLNNMPVLQRSVLSHINANISGMKVPWMYVGMCFSTFCWHNEDHWSYSINYLHWGEAKTWYGVPGDYAEEFEATMKEAAPELFESQPDLLHQLVTIMNPNVFILKGIPVYRTDQHAGEFVITFPRAYHAGFNQGYNFAEAVNFAPADWLEMGRMCVAHYAKCRRFCVFSHDELVCRMAFQAELLDLTMALATFMDVKTMVTEEKKLRRAMMEYGVRKSDLCRFERLPDDERQCDVCKTTCFLSAIKCSCNDKRIVCLQHYREICDCPPGNLILKYRYKSHEFAQMLQNLRKRFQPFTEWHVKTKAILEASPGEKQDYNILTSLMQEAQKGQYPSDSVLMNLKRALAKAEVVMDLQEKLRAGKYQSQISLESFQEVVDDLKNLPCEIANSDIIIETLEQTLKLQQESRILLNEEHPDSKELEKCINTMSFAPIELPEFRKLKQKLEQVNWLDEVKILDRNNSRPTLESIRTLISMGSQLPPHPHVESVMSQLQERLTKMETWEKKVTACVDEETKQKLTYWEGLLKEAGDIKGYLPSYLVVEGIVKEANEWLSKVQDIKESPFYPYMQTLDKLASVGRPMLVKLDVIRDMDILISKAKIWLDKAETTFLRKHAHYTLLEALCPRRKVGISTFRSRKRRCRDDSSSTQAIPPLVPVDEPLSPEDLVTAFKNVEAGEVDLMKALRAENLAKRLSDNGSATYCICQKEFSEGMLQCELCKDYFHGSCVPVVKVPNRTKQQTALAQLSHAMLREKFLCPCCMRSRRPRLDAILPLLVGLQDLPIRIPEGEALQILTERTMNWQDKARQALDTEELTAALAKLSVLSKKLNEAAAREKTEKIISTELKKAANNPELHCRVQAISSMSGICSEDVNVPQTNSDHSQYVSNEEEQPETSPGCGDPAKDGNAPYSNTEHAYSTASKSMENGKGKKHSRKSPLVPRQLEPPVLTLTESGQRTLEELMIEGDLLEIYVDEAAFIWRILQATRPRKDDKFPEFEEDDNSGKAGSKQKRKKRRPEETKETDESKKVKTSKASVNKRGEKQVKKPDEGPKSTIVCEDLSDNDEDCAAEPCRKPTGRELLWVQCDACNAWYHLHCIGMKKEQLQPDQDFMCPSCQGAAGCSEGPQRNLRKIPKRRQGRQQRKIKKEVSDLSEEGSYTIYEVKKEPDCDVKEEVVFQGSKRGRRGEVPKEEVDVTWICTVLNYGIKTPSGIEEDIQIIKEIIKDQ